MKARIRLADADVAVDLSHAISIARELDFADNSPQHFDAPAATSQPYAAAGFSGSVATGASCNCNVITVIPHCNGTHTECVGHLTREAVDAHRVVPTGLLPALLISVSPVLASDTNETTEPAPQPNDLLITREALESQWPASAFAPQALVLRTDRGARPAAYLTRQAAQLLVERAIDHLVIDLPSIDRDHDAGRLSAHRIFFGLARGENRLSAANRPHATVTELAHIPSTLADGPYLLQLQVPAWRGDAVPSRPLLYAFRQA